MDYYTRHELKKIDERSDEYLLVIYLDDHLTEFADELGKVSEERKDVITSAKQLLKKQYPTLKVTMVKVILGGMVVTSIPLGGGASAAQAAGTTTTQASQSVVAISPEVEAKADDIIQTGVGLIGKATYHYTNYKDVYPYEFGCGGFIYFTLLQNGIDIGTRNIVIQSQLGEYVPKDQWQKGDLLFFDDTPGTGSEITHVGIYMGNNKMVHMADPESDVIVSDLSSSSYYRNYYKTARRVIPSYMPSAQVTEADKLISFVESLMGKVTYGFTYNESTLTFNTTGFAYYAYKNSGVDLQTRNISEMATKGEYVPKDQLKKGDLVFFSNGASAGKPALVGIYAGNQQFYMLSDSAGIRKSMLSYSWYEQNYVTARRVLTEAPATGTTTPAAGTTAPEAGTTAPPAGTTTPEAGTTTPPAGTTAPEAGTTAPPAGTTTPEAGTTAPEAGTTAPPAGTTTPEAGTTTPAAGTTTPEAGTTAPATGTTTPEAGTTAPEVNAATGTDIVNFARSLLGKAAHGSYDENALTFDGEGFAYYVFKKNGIDLKSNTVASEQAKAGQYVPKNELQKGDLVFFSNDNSGQNITHVGIYVGNNRVIHMAGKSLGLTESSLSWGWYTKNYVTARRVANDIPAAGITAPEAGTTVQAAVTPATGTTAPATDTTAPEVNAATGTDIVNFAKSLLGKAAHGSYDENALTFDGEGFAYYVFKKNGIDLKSNTVASEQAKAGQYVPKSELQKGDLVFFSNDNSGQNITHVGIYIGNNRVIHMAGKSLGLTESSLSWGWYTKNYVTARRVL